MKSTCSIVAVLCLGWQITAACAQTGALPPASRTVFKCEVGGKVTYSDEPCAGAQRLEVQPTRGLNKSTGSERAGADVQREQFNEMFAEAVRPITGLSPQQLETEKRRLKLAANLKAECRRLDIGIAMNERLERTASDTDRPPVQADLLAARLRARSIGC